MDHDIWYKEQIMLKLKHKNSEMGKVLLMCFVIFGRFMPLCCCSNATIHLTKVFNSIMILLCVDNRSYVIRHLCDQNPNSIKYVSIKYFILPLDFPQKFLTNRKTYCNITFVMITGVILWNIILLDANQN